MIKPNKIHEECPNQTHCTHDEEKCMYLIKNKCIIREIRRTDKITEGEINP